jgi:hypothetical protein
LQQQFSRSANGARPGSVDRCPIKRPCQDFKRCADQQHRGRRAERSEQRLTVEEWRNEQEAGETHEHRAVAGIARLEEFDTDEHEQESDARVTAEEIPERPGDRDAREQCEQRERPRRDPCRYGGLPRSIPPEQHESQPD